MDAIHGKSEDLRYLEWIAIFDYLHLKLIDAFLEAVNQESICKLFVESNAIIASARVVLDNSFGDAYNGGA